MAHDGNMKEVKLGDLFDELQLPKVASLITEIQSGERRPQELRDYLESQGDALLAKEVVPAYLYYMLCYQFKLL